MVWTHFWDMSSGGSEKEDFTHCYIEASENEAVSVFFSRFGHNPHRVTCTCCGSDYSINEDETLEEATRYQLEMTGISLEMYVLRKDVKIISKDKIKKNERNVNVPEQGYVWEE